VIGQTSSSLLCATSLLKWEVSVEKRWRREEGEGGEGGRRGREEREGGEGGRRGREEREGGEGRMGREGISGMTACEVIEGEKGHVHVYA